MNKYIDAISIHVKATPVFCRDYEMGDYYAWDLCEFKFGALFDGVKHLSLYMFDSYFVLSFGFYWDGATLKLDDLKNMFAMLELDKRATSLAEKLGSNTKLKAFKPDILFADQHDSALLLILNDGVFEVGYAPDKITEYDQYDHYGLFDTSYEEPCYIDERLIRLMIAALEENKS